MLNRPSIAVNKRVVVLVVALLAMMTILVLSSPAQNGIFAHDLTTHGPDDSTYHGTDPIPHIHYNENDTGAVRDFDLTDPEGAAIEWNVRGLDADDFEISSAGVLTFKESPDYENPTDRVRVALDLNGDDDGTDLGEAAFTDGDNHYQITVSATEVWDGDNASLPAKRTDSVLTVIVENVNDPGKLTLQWLQPEVDTSITATLTDLDGFPDSPADPVWTWYTSKVVDPEVGTDFHWNTVTGAPIGATTSTTAIYTPAGDTVALNTDTAVDEGKHLRVKVVYQDAHGVNKTVYGISMNPVRAEVSDGENGSPDFADPTDTRTVDEDAAVRAAVGDPFRATDPDGDILTYTLEADTDVSGDLDFFYIDNLDENREITGTGQIRVKKELDFDNKGTPVDGKYKVVVRVTDPSGDTDTIMVTITAENVNEDPVVTGHAELNVVEGITDEDGNLDYTVLATPAHTYLVAEPDRRLDSIATWDLEGDDADLFDLAGEFEPRHLNFKEAPDYENPADMNRDNVYEVTIVATDTGKVRSGVGKVNPGVGKVNVTVTVTNREEDGKVVFAEGETAYLNETLVAQVHDPDDHGGDLGEPYQGVHIVTWQWSRSKDDNDPTGMPFVDIVDATTKRYTPKDDDRGYYLRAEATYTDPLSDEDDATTEEIDERIATDSVKAEMAITKNAVRVAPGQEGAPTFPEAVDGPVTRNVAESAGADAPVGKPVAAKAAVGETLTYTLDGPDKKFFAIDNTGQIRVGADDPSKGTETPEFDYDDTKKRNTFRVTVKVEVQNGADNQKAEVQVEISVTNVNELPVITDDDGQPVDTSVEVEVNYPEIKGEDKDGAPTPNTAAVAAYGGDDPEGETISWDLRGADAALFTIEGGMLKFKAPPDYENPKDVIGTDTATSGATATDNVYNIVIRAITSRASDDTGPAQTVDWTVAVTVTDVDEDGEVVISWLQPEVGTPITASLTDPDGATGGGTLNTEITPSVWKWEVSKVAVDVLKVDDDNHWGDAPGTGNASESYTPTGADLRNNPDDTSDDTPIDEDRYLRVTATYTDRNGADKMARMMSNSDYPVQARGGGLKNGSPDFEVDLMDRNVKETADVDANVGAPVVASVEFQSEEDTLTYGLRAVTLEDLDSIEGVTIPTTPAADLTAFNIDKASGQITVAGKLDFESRPTNAPHDGKYVVVVTVTDPSGGTPGSDEVVVVITANDVNEDPVLNGRPELTIDEINSSDEDANKPDFDGNPAAITEDPTENVYSVSDEDRHAGIRTWRLEGEDAEDFRLVDVDTRTLIFENDPNYEEPADANGDNIYKVTIVTLDGDGGRGEFNVSIEVKNIEEKGKVTLFDEDGVELVQPRAEGPITARLTDPDGGITSLTWVWTRSESSPNDSWPDISIHGTATYTPTNTDKGWFLRATATYRDAISAADDDRSAMATTTHSVLEVEDEGRAPKFPEDAASVEVAENSPSTAYVGDPIVKAVDLDGTIPTYTLEDTPEGDDAKHFELVEATHDADGDDTTAADNVTPTSPRQIVVGPRPLTMGPTVLDKEDDKKNTYTVVLKASDAGGLSDTITVTITVTDRNEAPSVPAASAPTTPVNAAPEFAAATDTRSVAENTAAGENIGDPVAATDADAGDTLTYTLGGTDMASFDIDGATGQLMTMAALDFEAPADADTNNAYEVTVTASDGNTADDATIAVTITVTDVAEGSELSPYDANENGVIEGPEVIQAVKDYFADDITGPEVIAVVKLYFAGRSN